MTVSVITLSSLFWFKVQGVVGQAPQNCLQYYQAKSGIIQTFNYDDVSAIIEVRQPMYFVSFDGRFL